MLTSLTLAMTIAVVTATQDTTELNADSLLKVLKQGGYTILLRHARTDHSYRDDPRTAPLDDRTKQRNLSDAGIADAKAIGVVMRQAGVPFAEIVSSPMFRAKETAQMAFGEPTLSSELMSLTATPEQRALVAKAPRSGANRVIVTHHFIIERYVPGIELGEIGESEAAVVRATPNGEVVMVGRFKLADWERLSGGRTGPVNAAEAHQAAAAFQAFHRQQAASAPGAIDWSATPAASLAGLYLHTFNSGDAEQMRAFVEKSLVADPNRSTDQRVEAYRGLFRDHGPFSIVGGEKMSHDEVSIRVRSKRGELSVVVKISPNDHSRAESIRLVGAP
ncbi:MAG TPA: histidine phosphatase family protein [Gemmatimonadaceae bacterium]|nr:histidine phosphatase family protein [Gemmatimonadaceae bacterium]